MILSIFNPYQSNVFLLDKQLQWILHYLNYTRGVKVIKHIWNFKVISLLLCKFLSSLFIDYLFCVIYLFIYLFNTFKKCFE